jgi:hypothetical protein
VGAVGQQFLAVTAAFQVVAIDEQHVGAVADRLRDCLLSADAAGELARRIGLGSSNRALPEGKSHATGEPHDHGKAGECEKPVRQE